MHEEAAEESSTGGDRASHVVEKEDRNQNDKIVPLAENAAAKGTVLAKFDVKAADESVAAQAEELIEAGGAQGEDTNGEEPLLGSHKSRAPVDQHPTSAQVFDRQAQMAIPAFIVAISGCMDSQVSSDVQDASVLRRKARGAGGACTQILLDILNSYSGGEEAPLLKDVLFELRSRLEEHELPQRPILTSSRKIDLASEQLDYILRPPVQHPSNKALCIGINYADSNEPLLGCQNDARAMLQHIKKHGWDVSSPASCRVLLDDGQHTAPTRDAILDALDWLAGNSEDGDSLFFSYAGHGIQREDTNNDEADSKDELLVPVDFQTNGCISDDEIMSRLVMKLHPGARLFCVIDCCHSGTCLDLPYKAVLPAGGPSADAGESGAFLAENSGFDFDKILGYAKAILDSIDHALENGLSNLANFVSGFKRVFPI